ncbi:4-hydroxyphenylacetaldehyde oxime monooxygenase-like [Phragmites australis]|uniref:4-hydroxyphenylacetaldehyde oxime monooxygenase-like n=1 Tax=Phragmites australis TaxID=29695 RepID=UPI002D79CB5B|nr:4-hydroxyphenylacetaldehyde oxime monooxygenase-like [Phragmites australis]
MAAHSLPDPFPWPLLPLLVPLFLLPLLYLFFRRKSGAHGAERSAPPGPPKQLPVLGNLLQIGSRPHRYFQAVARRYGPVVQVHLGRVRTVVVSSPQAAMEVLRTNDLHCCSRPNSPGARMLSYDFLDVAFSPYNEYWREMRKLFILELLSMRRVQSFSYARAAEVDRLVASLASSPPGAIIDLSEKLYVLSDGIIGTVAFGKMYGSAQFERSSFQRVMDETLRVLGSFTFEDFFPASHLARWADVLTGATGRRRSIFRKIDGFLDSVIDKHLEPERLQAGVQEDMVDALVKMWREKDNKALGLTRDHIKGILMDTFSGGIDTCAVTTIWIMSELMRNPRVMRKVQAEVRSLVRNKPRVDEEDVKNLEYLKMVIKENFRLHPPGTLLIPRETMQSCVIGGYDVSPGTRVFVNVWAMGRDASIWDNPEEFYPERFDGSHVDFRGSNFELLQFGSGRRACPAVAMGVANVELALANLLYCFDWELPEGMKEEDINMEETGQLVFRKMVPLCLVPIKRI